MALSFEFVSNCKPGDLLRVKIEDTAEFAILGASEGHGFRALVVFKERGAAPTKRVGRLKFQTESLPGFAGHTFGGIDGGAAMKYGIYQRQSDHEWMGGSPSTPRVLPLEEAVHGMSDGSVCVILRPVPLPRLALLLDPDKSNSLAAERRRMAEELVSCVRPGSYVWCQQATSRSRWELGRSTRFCGVAVAMAPSYRSKGYCCSAARSYQ
jgi:hypothetical protein